MKEQNLIPRLLPLFAIVLTVLVSCGEVGESGCTDLNALNYNPDAEMDNGTCEYERDKFFGIYSATSVCDTLGPWHNINFQLNIKPDAGSTKHVRMVFSHPSGNTIDFQAKVEGNTLTIFSNERVKPFGFCGAPPGHQMYLNALAILEGNQLSFLYFEPVTRQIMGAWTCFQVCEVEAVKN